MSTQNNEVSAQNDLVQRAFNAVREIRTKLEATEQAQREPIAIIGVGCRFPGHAHDRESFWRIIHDGIDTTSEIPGERWDIDRYYSENPDAPGKMYVRRGAFLDQVDRFDAAFFGIAPREALRMDPQQRLLLEIAWEALEDAGIPADRIAGSRTGVFIGISAKDYVGVQDMQHAPEGIDAYFSTGHYFSVASGRLSYVFGLHGPSVAIDTACSSSLVSVHLACQSIHAGESELALAGGVNLLLRPEEFIASSKLHSLAIDGRSKPFDAAANGYARGEGAGIVVLKRLSAAIADGDSILAVIKGSGISHNGASGGLTVPNGIAWQMAMQQAARQAALDVASIDYLEAHGTGTPLGDPIELQAVSAMIAQKRAAASPLVVGSVKPNIGHLEAAAGIAGLIKVVMMLQHAHIPRQLNLHAVNPRIDLDQLQIAVPLASRPWERGPEPRRAGLDSAGISGTEVHVIVEEAPAPAAATPPEQPIAPCYILPLSARDPRALRDLAGAYRPLLAEGSGQHLADRCYTASVRRTHHAQRMAVVGRTPQELQQQLESFLGEQHPGGAPEQRAHGAAKPMVFVCPGQGSQWAGMAQMLMAHEPVFLDALHRCDAAFQRYQDWSIIDMLQQPPEQPDLKRIDVIQPLICAIQIALADLWRSWGIIPDAVIGHSMGEVAAAQIAGILSLDDAGKIICRRSQLLCRISGRGRMAAVALPIDQAQAALAPYADLLSVAVSNGPSATVISGDSQALGAFQRQCQREGIACTFVKVDVASHSPQVDCLREDLAQALGQLRPQAAAIPMYSTVYGRVVEGTALEALYWLDNLREPVLFGPTIARMVADGYTSYIELSPHPLLTTAVSAYLEQSTDALVLPSLRREQNDLFIMYTSLGELYAHGYSIDWKHVYRSGRNARLPAYPWQRQRYWPEPPKPARATLPLSTFAGQAFHGRRIPSPLAQIQYETRLGIDTMPFLADHQLASTGQERLTLVSGSAYIALVLSAARAAFGQAPMQLRQARFIKALPVPEAGTTIQVVFSPLQEAGLHTFEIYSASDAGTVDKPLWQRHAHGILQCKEVILPDPASVDLLALQEHAQHIADRAEIYEQLRQAGYCYGPQYQWQERSWRLGDTVLAAFRAPCDEDRAEHYGLHPGLLDSMLQVLCARLIEVYGPELACGDGWAYVPTGIDHMIAASNSQSPLWARGSLQQSSDSGMVGDVEVYTSTGDCVLSLRGISFQRVRLNTLRGTAVPDAVQLYQVQWQPQVAPALQLAYQPGEWLIFDDPQGVGRSLGEELVRSGARYSLFTMAEQPPEQLPLVVAEWYERHRKTRKPCLGVVYPALATAGCPGSEQALEASCQALDLMRALICNSDAQNRSPLWIITQGVQGGSAVDQAPIWGLGRSFALEHADLWGGLIDTDSRADIVGIARELMAGPHAQQVWLHEGQRLVAQLGRLPPAAAQAQPRQVRGDGVYLITGGLGSMGLLVAQRLADAGAQHIVLVGHHNTPPEASAVLSALQSRGVSIQVRYADVASLPAMRQIIAQIDAGGVPLVGVIHSAGVLDDGVLLNQTRSRLEKVFAPKVAGAWNLHLLTKDRALDTFMLFSSAVALLGAPGQANYAAASMFLDTLAASRRAQGLPAQSINWGPWIDTGLAVTEHIQERGFYQYMDLIPRSIGVDIFEQILYQDIPQVGVFSLRAGIDDPNVLHRKPILAGLAAQSSSPRAGEPVPSAQPSATLPIAEQVKHVGELLHRAIRKVLGLAPNTPVLAQRPLRELGFDSLMAIELRDLLRGATGLMLPATLVYNYPTADAISAFLLGQLGGDDKPAATPDPEPTAPTGYDPGDLADDLADLSEEDLEALLLRARVEEEER